MLPENTHEIVEEVSRLLLDVISLGSPPGLPERYASVESLQTLHARLVSLRELLYAAANGDLTRPVPFKGYMGGTLKALQANLRHLTWQTKMVASGDFTQRVEFMGEFAQSFNAMVMQLDRTLKELVDKDTELSKSNKELLKEVAIRKHTEAALLEREEILRHLATTDSLTDLYNRRHFNQLAEGEIRRAIRYSRPLSVLMLDIDFFKRVNDTYGHTIGDVVLQEIARITKALVRTTDIAARYGGEEFIVLLPETLATEAAAVAEKLRSRVEGSPIQTEKGPIAITASLGVSDILEEKDGIYQESVLTDFINKADQALYASKKTGRNKVTIYGPSL